MIRFSNAWPARRRRWLVATGPLLVFALVAAACSSGSSSKAGGTGSSSGSSSKQLPAATISGTGSTFQAAYDNEVIQAFKPVQPKITVNYPATGAGGSGKGQTDLQGGVVQFAGSDGIPPAADLSKYTGGKVLYFPTVAGPITMSYNLSGVQSLKLDADTIAKMFSGSITKWNDPAITALNSGTSLPDTDIVTVHRSDSSGTTGNFTKYLTKAAPQSWTRGSDKTINWPGGQAGNGNGGVAQLVKNTPNAIGYVDFSDAKAAGLSFASVKNKAGKYVAASVAGASAAVAGATIQPDLSYDPIDASGDASYPITSPTYILAYQKQTNAAQGNALKAFLAFIYADGQDIAKTVDFAPLSSDLLGKAKAQLDQFQIPAS